MKYIKIAIRNLNRQKRRSFLLGGAIAFGILVITLVNGFTAGISENVKHNFAQLFSGHVFVEGREKTESDKVISVIRNDDTLQSVFEKLGYDFSDFAKRSAVSAELIFEGESIRQQIVGVDWNSEKGFRDSLALQSGSIEAVIDDPQGIVISQQMAKQLGIQVGETLLVKLQTVTGQQNVGDFVLRGTQIDPGMLGSMAAYAHIEYVNRLINIPENSYQSIQIAVEDERYMDAEARRIYQALSAEVQMAPRMERPEFNMNDRVTFKPKDDEKEKAWTGVRYKVTTLNDYLSQIDQLLAILNNVGYGVLGLLLIIIMVGISNTFRMVMYERVREIGTMRALGMQRKTVGRIFLLEALFLSIAGVVAGVIVGYLAMGILSLFNFGTDNMFSLFLDGGHLSFNLVPLRVLFNLLIIALITLLAAFFPSRSAAKLHPADALRKQY